MFNLGGWEIALLVICGLIFFGPNKLPQLMRQAGKIMHEIKKASSEFQFSIERELEDDEYKRQHRREKKRRKKLIEAGLDPDAPAAPVDASVASNGAAPEGAVAANGAEPVATENTILPPPAPTPETKSGS